MLVKVITLDEIVFTNTEIKNYGLFILNKCYITSFFILQKILFFSFTN
jgi:hypothetical protein